MAFGAGAAFAISYFSESIYQASTTLLINQAPASRSTPDYNSLLTSERLAQTYAELLRKRPVLEAVIKNLKLAADVNDVEQRIRVSVVRNTQLIELSVEDTQPQRAADIANEIVKVFSQQNRDTQAGRYASAEQNLAQELAKIQADIDRTQASLSAPSTQQVDQGQLQAQLAQQRGNYATLFNSLEEVRLAEAQETDNIAVAEPAKAESIPIRPRTVLNTLLGSVIGMMAAFVLLFLIEYLDDTVKASEEFSTILGTPTLASVGRIAGYGSLDRLVTVADSRSPIAEEYRLLRVNIEFAALDRPSQTILVTSTGSGEGKSTTISNLAVAIARTGKRVILVDADLRRPALHRIFHLPNDQGVTTALIQHEPGTIGNNLLRTGIRNIRLLPSGPLPPNPAELLGSQRMRELIEELKGLADVVLLDSPPLLPVVDAALLARNCDATLLVALSATTRKNLLRRAKEQLVQSGANIIGGVLNRVQAAQGRGYGYGYYSYNSDSTDKKRRTVRLPFLRKSSADRPAVIDEEGLAAIVDVGINSNDHYELEIASNGNGHRNGMNGTGPYPKIQSGSRS
jgi:non-specific protein-tyrosine kinase